MRTARSLVAWLLAGACLAPRTASADSVFGIRGLGLLGRPLSSRALSAGGAFGLFDASSALNPASLVHWLGPAGWGVGVATSRRFADGPVSASLGSTRFPLFGFATAVGQRLVVGVAISDYLDRTWSVSTTKDSVLRDTSVTFTDVAHSTGGVSDLRVAAAYRVSNSVAVGVAVHALAGSTRLSVERSFSASSFLSYRGVAITDFSGVGVSLGAQVRVSEAVAVAGAMRFNGRLKAAADDGNTLRVALPSEFAAGVLVAPVRGVALAATAGYQTWARAAADLQSAGQERSRSVWNLSVGGEFETVRLAGIAVPLRVGYRWRQLPFPVAGAALDERAVSGGLGLTLAGGRATLDVGLDVGRRTAGASEERFTSGFVGVIVRP